MKGEMIRKSYLSGEISMGNNRFAFVILHYNIIEITEQCIESILNGIDWKDYKIIVVDNASPDGSGRELLEKYQNTDRVAILLNQTNLGFARGNNVGIQYAKEVLKADFVCCINNDTIMTDRGFVSKTVSEFLYSSAAVIGPQIICSNGMVQKVERDLKSAEQYEEFILMIEGKRQPHQSRFKNFMEQSKFLMFLHEKIYCMIYEKRMQNIILHGCCLTFTPKFFEKLNGFNEKTFLFAEEELLFLALKRNQLISVYNPKIKIKHLEDQATDSICDTEEEKRAFINNHRIHSLKILIQEIRADENKASVANV